MKHTEKDLEMKCVLYARTRGLVAVKLENNGNVGIPDRLFVAKGGRTLFVEFKRPDGGGRVSREQVFFAQFLEPNYYMCNSYDDFCATIEQFFAIKKLI